MIVKKNTPPPVVAPPATFDLIGLTQEETLALRCILARRKTGTMAPLENIRRQIYAVTSQLDQPFEIKERYEILRKADVKSSW